MSRLTARRASGLGELGPFMQMIQAHSKQNLPPVFYSSPLPESNFYDWKAGLANESYLYAPFVAYPMKNRVLPLPFTLDTNAVKAHIDEVLQSELSTTPEVVFVWHSFEHDDIWKGWFVAHMREMGFTADIQSPNLYRVIIFSRQRPATRLDVGGQSR